MKITEHGANLLAQAVKAAYAQGQTDYSMEPLARQGETGDAGRIKAGDAVVFCCRRGEREIELTDAFVDPRFSGFDRELLTDLDFVIMTLYHEKFSSLPVAFMPSKVEDTLAQAVSQAGLGQLHCSESEKFAHITFFFNGGQNKSFAKETDICVPSPKGVPFDQKPELSLAQVAQEVTAGIHEGYDFILTNFANGDVIGHTANDEAKIQCAGFVSRHLGQVVDDAVKAGYTVAITADHGNLETLHTKDGKPHVAHTQNPVYFILVGADEGITLRDGVLADTAPTLLELMGLPQPAGMTATSLITQKADKTKTGKTMLIILDGWGIGSGDENDAIYLGDTPEWDRLLADNPHCRLEASGEAVGLQASKTGNSEAGHLNLGAGRVVPQDDVRLDTAMQDGSFTANEVFQNTLKKAKESGAALHLISYLSHKSSHGTIDYPLALVGLAKEKGLTDVYLHIIFDGRSTPPGSAPALLEELENELAALGLGQVVDGIGRGLALDRDGNYGKIKKTYDMMVHGFGASYGE